MFPPHNLESPGTFIGNAWEYDDEQTYNILVAENKEQDPNQDHCTLWQYMQYPLRRETTALPYEQRFRGDYRDVMGRTQTEDLDGINESNETILRVVHTSTIDIKDDNALSVMSHTPAESNLTVQSANL